MPSDNYTVFFNQTVSANGISRDNVCGHVLAGQGALHLVANTPRNPLVNILQGRHEFQIRVNRQANRGVNVGNPSARLSFNNDRTLNGNALKQRKLERCS